MTVSKELNGRSESERRLCVSAHARACVCACVYLLRQVGEDLGTYPIQSFHNLSLRKKEEEEEEGIIHIEEENNS